MAWKSVLELINLYVVLLFLSKYLQNLFNFPLKSFLFYLSRGFIHHECQLIFHVHLNKEMYYLLFFLYSKISNWSCCWCSRAYSTRATVSLSVNSPYINPQLWIFNECIRWCLRKWGKCKIKNKPYFENLPQCRKSFAD